MMNFNSAYLFLQIFICAFCYYQITRIREPLIAFVTEIFGSSSIYSTTLYGIKHCEYKCRIVNDKKLAIITAMSAAYSNEYFRLYNYADVAIFHSRDMQMDTIYSHQNPNRLNVFFTMEPYPYEKIENKKFPKDFFNVTMTFRRDSTIWRIYGKFEYLLPDEINDASMAWTDSEIDEAISKKKKLALQIVSHCETDSKREKLIEKMRELTNLTLVGKCHQNILERDPGVTKKAYQEHFFYLAFENAACKDYITEKFWKIRELIVPVVLKRSILTGIVDDEYFIAADDFDSPNAFVDRLIYLSKNITEYKKYLSWTKKYRKTFFVNGKEFCKLCEMAVKKERHIIPDIYQWWKNKSECIHNFVDRIF